MKANPLLLPLVLSLALAACGQDQPAEGTAPAEAVAKDANQAGMAEPAVLAAGAGADEVYAAKCVSCHGETGEGMADNPKLVGLSKADIESRLKDYRDGKQLGPKTAIMAAMAKPLTDEQIADLANYLGE